MRKPNRNQSTLFFEHIGQTSTQPIALEVSKAKGIYLYDQHDKPFMDFISGISVSNLGHGNAKIIDAIATQSKQYMHTMVYGEYILSPQTQLADELTSRSTEELNCVYYVNSGSEAIEAALKLAKKFTGRNNILAFKNAYHGSTHGALSLMSNYYFTNAYHPLLPGIGFLEYDDFSELKKIDQRCAAVVVEIIRSEAGYLRTDTSFIQALEKRCKELDVLLIVDEIQTGFGRTGELFAHMSYDIKPDMVCLAKAFGGGMPLGGILSKKSLMDSFSNRPVLGHISTFGGNPVCCAAALAHLQQITPELLSSISQKEKHIREKLAGCPAIQKITGKGLMLALHLENAEIMHRAVDTCFEKGLIIDWFLHNESALRVAPPLIISHDEIEKGCDIILESLK